MTMAKCPWTFKPLEDGATVSPYTQRELPDGWTDSVTHCVAMAGARNSGKSLYTCLLYTSPSPRDRQKSRMPSSA